MFDRYKSMIKHRSYKNPQVVRDKILSSVLWICRWVFILALCYLFLFPMFFLISTSLQDPSSVNDPSVIFIPKLISLDSIKEMISILNYWDSALLTLEIAVFSTLASLVSCSLVGYGFSRFNFKFKNVFFVLVILTIIVPRQVILPSLALNFQFFDFGGVLSLLPEGSDSINLVNTVWTFVLPSLFSTGLRSGVFIFIFRQFFLGLPKDLEEAARIDGCGAIRTYVRIIAPLAVPAFVTVALFSFVWHWNDLYSSSMFFSSEIKPLMPLLDNLSVLIDRADIGTTAYSARTYMASAPLLAVLPPLILYIFTQRFFTESIERSGIVG
ncbi:MAG: carbohydrate ABC transporter permease [Clostridia bacterium]|nr:carbohydrate ABC transporter permease [Clostridia bacterium]